MPTLSCSSGSWTLEICRFACQISLWLPALGVISPESTPLAAAADVDAVLQCILQALLVVAAAVFCSTTHAKVAAATGYCSYSLGMWIQGQLHGTSLQWLHLSAVEHARSRHLAGALPPSSHMHGAILHALAAENHSTTDQRCCKLLCRDYLPRPTQS